jgi:hypothetical protein
MGQNVFNDIIYKIALCKFSPIRLFCHKYIETKRKSAKSDCVINSYII